MGKEGHRISTPREEVVGSSRAIARLTSSRRRGPRLTPSAISSGANGEPAGGAGVSTRRATIPRRTPALPTDERPAAYALAPADGKRKMGLCGEATSQPRERRPAGGLLVSLR